MQDEIWLIGGYGDVGLKTARMLLDMVDNPLVLAGRNGEAANRAAEDLGPRVRGETLDVSAATELPAGQVLNFVEASPPALAAGVVARGGLFVDASAEPDYLQKLRTAIGEGPGLAVLNAGLTPGLTNILAREIVTGAPHTRAIDVVLEMGLGRHHGYSATAGSFRGLAADYRGKRAGEWVTVRPGDERREVRYGPDADPVPAFGFGFSDQQAIAETLDLDTARTFLAFDPAYMTRLSAWIAGGAVGRWAARHAERLTDWMSRMPPAGGVGTRLLVEGLDREGRPTRSIGFKGADQAEITAIMLSLAMVEGLRGKITGPRNMDAVVPYETARAALNRRLPATRWFGDGAD